MTNRENAAHKLLRLLGANGGYLGFYYTATAIEIVMDSGKTIYQCKWLYNEVAELRGEKHKDPGGYDLELWKPAAFKGTGSLSVQRKAKECPVHRRSGRLYGRTRRIRRIPLKNCTSPVPPADPFPGERLHSDRRARFWGPAKKVSRCTRQRKTFFHDRG